MSLLIVEIPPRTRLSARQDAAAGSDDAVAAPKEWFYVFSNDGRHASRSGQAALSLLPHADTVVAVLDATDVAWQRVNLPRVSAAKLRAALAGALEEALLDEPEAAHFALGAPGTAAEGRWVAVMHRPWLTALLTTLDEAGLGVDRIVPASLPRLGAESARGWFHLDRDAAPAHALCLTLASAQGVCSLRAHGGLPRQLLPPGAPADWSATPEAAAPAEHWLGAAVPVQSHADRLMIAAAADINLRQFELAPRHRGTRWLRDAARRLMGREWRWLRWGLAALLLVQIVGLNLFAWQQSRQLLAKRQTMDELLRSAHPQVRAVLDAPLQMQRETEALRAAAGRPGEGDFEVLLGAVSAAWPDGLPPVQTLRFEPGKLALAAPGVAAAQLPALRERLRAAGLDADAADGRVQITRAGAARQP